jgi:cytochrome c oxidase assembly factor CtaG
VATLPPFHWQPFGVVAILALGAGHFVLVRDTRCRGRAAAALVAIAVVTLWPVGDLAATVSLSVATAQRLVLMLLVAPLLVRSVPVGVAARATRSAPVDAAVRVVAKPGVALAIVMVVGTASLTSPVVDAGAHHGWVRVVTLALDVVAGAIMWLPVLDATPGTTRLSPVGRAGYLFGASLLVTSVSFVWIFSRHSLYPALHDQRAVLGVSAVTDQQIAGFVAKFGAYVPMWTMAFLAFARAGQSGAPPEGSPLHWADVERELVRVDRQRARARRRHPDGPLGTVGGPGT